MTVDARRLFPALVPTDPRVDDRRAQENPLLAELRAKLADEDDGEDVVVARVSIPPASGRRRLVPVMALDEVERWFG